LSASTLVVAATGTEDAPMSAAAGPSKGPPEESGRHPAVAHMHDHFHAAHVRGDTEQGYWHTHEHEHDQISSRADVATDTEDHAQRRHDHDHGQTISSWSSDS
jgi:hypothetical protein